MGEASLRILDWSRIISNPVHKALLNCISMSDNEDNGGKEQDRFLPIANIARIMKKQLPSNAKIAKDAKEVSRLLACRLSSLIELA